jgi:CheY-like chemotaxis protein
MASRSPPTERQCPELRGGERLRRARRPRFRDARQQDHLLAIAGAHAVGAVCLHSVIVIGAGALLAAAPPVSDKPTSECAVLIVEDDASIRRLVRTVLLRQGYNVEIAGDGVEAVSKLGLVDYDVIILDLMMPNMDGFAFMTAMARNTPERLKRVIITSAASPSIINEKLKGIPFDLLPKPFDIEELLSRVGECVKRAE